MPRPTAATTLQRPDLGAIAYEYSIEAPNRGFIGLKIMPIFDVPLQSSDYPKIPIESLIKLMDTKRAARTNWPRSDWEFETGTYACLQYGWEELLDDWESKLYRRYFDAEVACINRATDIVLRGQEARIAAKIFNSNNFTVSDVAIAWNTPATAVPRTNVTVGKQAMRAASGLEPNLGVCSKKVFETLMLTSELKDALKYTNPIEMGGFEAQKRTVAAYFGLNEIAVGNAIKDTAKKGQVFTLGDIWDDEYFGLFKVSDGGQDLRDPCVGRTFVWTEDTPGALAAEQYREEGKSSSVYRIRNNADECFVFQGAGYLLGNIVHP